MPPPNFSKVEDGIYRGGRPIADDYAYLESLGIRSIVNLEGASRGAEEYHLAGKFEWFWFPISPQAIYLTGVPGQLLNYLLNKIDSLPKPIFVHCQHGEDRTGLVIAIYRIRVCGWSYEKAYSEALANGYRDDINLGLNRSLGQYKEKA